MSHHIAVPYLYEPKVGPDEWNRRRTGMSEAQMQAVPSWEALRMDILRHRYAQELGTELTETQKALLDRIVVLQTWCDVRDYRYRVYATLHTDEYVRQATALAKLVKEFNATRAGKPGKVINLRDYTARRA